MSHHHLIPAWLELRLYNYHTEMATHFIFSIALFNGHPVAYHVSG